MKHIPGPPSLPIIRHNFSILDDPYGTQQRWIHEYGNVYKTHMLGRYRINLCGTRAIEHVLLDKEQIFSSAKGWDALSRVFAGGLIVQDFDIHRRNRRIMTSAFRADQIREYQKQMAIHTEALINSIPTNQTFDFYETIKRMTLEIGGNVFMGLTISDDRINQAIKAQIRATTTPIRYSIPGTPMYRGLKARSFLIDTFKKLIPERRAYPGPDFFSQMCIATDDEGNSWTEEEILDQFNLLIMAAHDTTATTTTVAIDKLTRHPEWQHTLRQEINYDLRDRPLTDMFIKECLRLVPPVPFIPRQTTRDTEFNGYFIPANTSVVVNPGTNMIDPTVFPQPTKFNPERFTHHPIDKFAWVPFGGGAHKCIGQHFAMTQIKTILAIVLSTRKVTTTSSLPHWERMPIPKPKNGLPVKLRKL